MAVREPLNPIILVVFAPVFVCFWLIVSSTIAQLTGWKAMASQYRALGRPDGIRYLWRSLRLSAFVGYNHCINVTLTPHGLHLIPSLPFRFGHAPLLVPWDRVGAIERRRFTLTGCVLPIRHHECLEIAFTVFSWRLD